MKYPPAYPELARKLYQPGVYGYKQVAADLGVPQTTIIRWVNPAYAERQRAACRRNKQRYRGVCVDCGVQTAYSGVGTQGSERCRACRATFEQSPEQRAARTKWTREIVLARIREWADVYGAPPTLSDWDPWRARFRLGDEDRARRVLLSQQEWPDCTTVVRRFGSWNAAIAAAGFEPNAPSGAALRWNGPRRRRSAPAEDGGSNRKEKASSPASS